MKRFFKCALAVLLNATIVFPLIMGIYVIWIIFTDR